MPYKIWLTCGTSARPLHITAVPVANVVPDQEIEYGMNPDACVPGCYEGDPLPDTPNFDFLNDPMTPTSEGAYGLLPMEEVRLEIIPYESQTQNWRICDTYDYSQGPDEEGDAEEDRYLDRWVVMPAGTSFVYGKVDELLSPVPDDLFVGVDFAQVFSMSISFDANARPVFAYQVEAGTFVITRYVAGVPTTYEFGGDWPKLFFDGVVQPDQAAVDLVVMYVRMGVIYTRIQRDNFLIERTFVELPSGLQAAKLKKTDWVQSYQYLYYLDETGRLRLARSEVYPAWPVRVSDDGTHAASPGGGSYSLVVVAAPPVSEDVSNTASPAGGDYVSVVVTSVQSDDTSHLASPAGGDYPLVVSAAPPVTEDAAVTSSPAGGEYIHLIIDGGTYSDASTNLTAPAGGTYALA